MNLSCNASEISPDLQYNTDTVRLTYRFAAIEHGRHRHRSGIRRFRKRIVYAWTALLHQRACRDWYQFALSPQAAPFVTAYPGLLLKPLKPYLAAGLKIDQRVKVIQDSLQLMLAHWQVFQGIIECTDPVIAQIAIASGETISLSLEYNLQKEGELILLLRMPDGKIAAIAAFAFERDSNGDYAMRIGRNQGVKDHELIKSLEKEMYGLRPKNLMLFVCQELARTLGVQTLYGVSNRQQVYKHKVLITIPGARRLAFDYDSFWREVGGVEAGDWFRLPIQLEKRDLAEIKSKKRSMYKKRYTMLDELALKIQALSR